MNPRTAAVLLVDPAGRILLQLRDGNAPIGKHKWAVPGGYVEPAEDPHDAAIREVREETGIELDVDVDLFWHGSRKFSAGRVIDWFVFCAPTNARQEDVVLGEGEAMVFIPPGDIQALDLAQGARYFLTLFLKSTQYERLCASSRPDQAS
jgi:8-oxo-dGTP pyrophosphatase MutT (NUDIX family)